MSNLRPLAMLVAATLAAGALAAGAAVELTTHVAKEQRTANADGTTTIALVPSIRALPGDRLVYTIAYRNRTAAPIAGIVVDDPLPPGVTFVAASPGTPPPEVSLDGRTFGPLASLIRPGVAGPATPEEVTHLRWRVAGQTPPGGGGEVSFRAILK